jgi:hypothetical protein
MLKIQDVLDATLLLSLTVGSALMSAFVGATVIAALILN